MNDVLVDNHVECKKLIDTATGKTIVLDLTNFTLPQRYELHKIQKRAAQFAARFKEGMIGE